MSVVAIIMAIFGCAIIWWAGVTHGLTWASCILEMEAKKTRRGVFSGALLLVAGVAMLGFTGAFS